MKVETEAYWEEFEAEIREAKPDTTLLSSEHFAIAANPEGLVRRLRKTFDKITALFYFRDPVDFYTSMTNQSIKFGLRFQDTTSPAAFAYRHLHVAQKFADLLGRDSIITRNFDRKNLHEGDVVKDFFNVISQQTGLSFDIQPGAKPQNESLAGATTAWMLSFNEIHGREAHRVKHPSLKRRAEVVRRFIALDKQHELSKFKLTDPELIAIIRQNADKDVRKINSEFLQGQIPLKTHDGPTVRMSEAEAQEKMKAWFMSYLTPEVVPLIIEELYSPTS